MYQNRYHRNSKDQQGLLDNLYATENPEEMDNLWGPYNSSKLKLEKTEQLNSSIIITEIKMIIKCFSQNRSPGPSMFFSKFF